MPVTFKIAGKEAGLEMWRIEVKWIFFIVFLYQNISNRLLINFHKIISIFFVARNLSQF